MDLRNCQAVSTRCYRRPRASNPTRCIHASSSSPARCSLLVLAAATGATFFLLLKSGQNFPFSVLSPNRLRSSPVETKHEQQILLSRHRFHRRLNQEREQDQKKHVTSYSQRHQNFYSNNPSGYASRSGTNGSQSGTYYAFDDDAETSMHRRYHRRSTFYTDLSDVGLCLVTALGWAVWMISSFLSSKKADRAASHGMEDIDLDERFFAQKSSLLVVRGNVRQVSVQSHDDDILGLPGVTSKYTAIVDYVVENEVTFESIQIRKQFETPQALEEGFANVELLVLPGEPTHSILKDDFEQQIMQEQRVFQLEQEALKRGMSYESMTEHDEDDPLLDVLKGRYCNRKVKRLSTGFAATLVLASLAGTVQVVCLMDPMERWMGWVAVCVGTTFLLPSALLIHKCMHAAVRWQEPSEKQGVIVQSTTNPRTLEENPTGGTTVVTSGNRTNMSIAEACMPPSYCANIMDDLCDQTATDGVSSKFTYAEAASYAVPAMSGCYFVHYPTHKSSISKHERRRTKLASPSQQSENGEEPPRVCEMTKVSSSDGEICEISSASTVSSMSDHDPVEGVSPRLWDDVDSTV